MSREALDIENPGHCRRRKPRTRWKDQIAADMQERGLRTENCENRNT